MKRQVYIDAQDKLENYPAGQGGTDNKIYF